MPAVVRNPTPLQTTASSFDSPNGPGTSRRRSPGVLGPQKQPPWIQPAKLVCKILQINLRSSCAQKYNVHCNGSTVHRYVYVYMIPVLGSSPPHGMPPPPPCPPAGHVPEWWPGASGLVTVRTSPTWRLQNHQLSRGCRPKHSRSV